MVEQLIVVLIVLLAAFYAGWRWMPARYRHALAGLITISLRRAGLIDQARAVRWAASLSKARGCGSGCDSRAGCGGCAGGDANGAREGEAVQTHPIRIHVRADRP